MGSGPSGEPQALSKGLLHLCILQLLQATLGKLSPVQVHLHICKAQKPECLHKLSRFLSVSQQLNIRPNKNITLRKTESLGDSAAPWILCVISVTREYMQFSYSTCTEYFPCLCNLLKAICNNYITLGTCWDLPFILLPGRCQACWVESQIHPRLVHCFSAPRTSRIEIANVLQPLGLQSPQDASVGETIITPAPHLSVSVEEMSYLV